jgi:hypothetical protein
VERGGGRGGGRCWRKQDHPPVFPLVPFPRTRSQCNTCGVRMARDCFLRYARIRPEQCENKRNFIPFQIETP